MQKNYTIIKKIALVGLLILSGLNSERSFAQCSNIVLTPFATDSWCPGTCTGMVTSGFSGVSSTGPWTFEWSDGTVNQSATNLCGGTYTLTFTDGGYTNCTKTTTATVNAPAAFSVGMSHTNPTSCSATNGTATASATGGTGTKYYTWSSGAAVAAVTNLVAATYTLTVSDTRGCETSTTVTLTCVSGVKENSMNNNLSLFPNPVSNSLNLEMDGITAGKSVSIVISNMLGQAVTTINENNSAVIMKKQIDVSSLPNGLYFIAIENDNKKAVKTFVKSQGK